MAPRPRIAVRGLILSEDKLLLVNAYRGRGDLWTAPGGGVEAHASLPDNLIREVHEETGLTVSVGALALVNEFHDPDGSFHQIDLYFWCQIEAGSVNDAWRDPEGIVTERRWVGRDEIEQMQVKPDSLAAVAWGGEGVAYYDPLEPIIR